MDAVLVLLIGMAAFAGGVGGALLGAIVVLHDWPFHVVRSRSENALFPAHTAQETTEGG